MKIFIICCLLFIHVNMCIYIMHIFIESPYFSYYVAIQSGFRISIRVLGIRGFGFGDGLSPESVFGAVSGFGFGFGCTETPPDPNPPRCHPWKGADAWVQELFQLMNLKGNFYGHYCSKVAKPYGFLMVPAMVR